MSNHWVDTHFHVFNAGISTEGARYIPQYAAPLSAWTQQASDCGVTRGVLVQPSFLGSDNSLMTDALRSHPDSLRGIAVVRPEVTRAELQTLHQAGVRGIRLNVAGISHEIPEWQQADSVWEAIHAMGWHIEVHTDQGKLPQVIGQLPSDIPLVVDHMAKPVQASVNDASLMVLKKRASIYPVYVKLSGAYRLGDVDSGRLAALLIDEFDPHSLLWGSDWPCTNHEKFADFERLILRAHEWIKPEFFEQIMSRNPMKLYWGTD